MWSFLERGGIATLPGTALGALHGSDFGSLSSCMFGVELLTVGQEEPEGMSGAGSGIHWRPLSGKSTIILQLRLRTEAQMFSAFWPCCLEAGLCAELAGASLRLVCQESNYATEGDGTEVDREAARRPQVPSPWEPFTSN